MGGIISGSPLFSWSSQFLQMSVSVVSAPSSVVLVNTFPRWSLENQKCYNLDPEVWPSHILGYNAGTILHSYELHFTNL